MKSIRDLILKIKERPAMYLGKNYICCLRSYIDGALDVGAVLFSDVEYYYSFCEYISEKYNCKSQSWDRILLIYSSDENSALTLCFEEICEFEKRTWITPKEIDDSRPI